MVGHVDLITRVVTEAEAAAASVVVHESFIQLASRDWEVLAQQVFLADSSPENLADKIRAASYAAGTFVNTQMVGFLLMPTASLLGMLFVDPKWLRQGVARRLWDSARAHLEAAVPSVKTVEVNSTPYALEFYRAVGFVPISAQFERYGARTTRMACWLPARALGAELPQSRR
jgi:ribosomal protein S18 acetylase RimI-like enzyme